MYKRQIAYLDLIEYGEKKGSKGFCKWEQKNGVHTLSFSISGLSQRQSGLARVLAEEKVLGEIQIQNGRASETFVIKDSVVDGVSFFSKIRIPIEGCELLAEFETDTVCNQQTGAGHKEMGSVQVGMKSQDASEFRVMEAVQEVSESQIMEDVQEVSKPQVMEEAQELSESQVAENVQRTPEPEEMEAVKAVFRDGDFIRPDSEKDEEPSLISLWDILATTHECIHPFSTEAEYYRITLEDILLLKEKYHILRKNQFLFHGYYNYKYLILGKKEEDSEEYWLGVPGIYHEREKMAARMYGFEKFEGAKTRYGVGDLGYYLITVE